MSEKKSGRRRQSKAQLAVNLQTHNRSIYNRINFLCNMAESVLETEAPTKRQRRRILDTVESLLALQGCVEEKIPQLVPKDCSKYSISRLHAANNHASKTQ